MKTLFILLIAIVIASCSSEPNIEMRITNPEQGFNITGTTFMKVINRNKVITNLTPSTIRIQFNPKNDILYFDNEKYTVVEYTDNNLTFETDTDTYVIEFNTGYVWQDKNTKTKFDVYKYNNKQIEYIVYTYNN
jgi:hypothetical protein